MIPSFIQKQQIVKPREQSPPPKKDVVFEFQNFRRDTQLRAQTASIAFLQPTNLEQFQTKSSQQKYSIEALLSRKQREAADAAWDKLSPAAEQPLSSSQSFQSSNGFLSSTLQKERDQSFERQFANSFHSRQKKQLQQNLLSPKRNGTSKGSQSTVSSLQFSPEKRVQTPARYIQRLGSSSSSISSSSTKNRPERRSKSIQQGGLQELFQETKSKAQLNQVTPSRPRTNSQSFLKSSESFQTSQAAFVVDKRAHDLEETLMGLNPKDFNSLPRESIEQLIKLSSVIMTKVKSSNFYKTSVF